MYKLTLLLSLLPGASGPQASPTWQSYATDVSATARRHTVSGLRPAQSYQFQVSAVNAVGKGPASQPSSIITLPEQREFSASPVFAKFSWSDQHMYDIDLFVIALLGGCQTIDKVVRLCLTIKSANESLPCRDIVRSCKR